MHGRTYSNLFIYTSILLALLLTLAPVHTLQAQHSLRRPSPNSVAPVQNVARPAQKAAEPASLTRPEASAIVRKDPAITAQPPPPAQDTDLLPAADLAKTGVLDDISAGTWLYFSNARTIT